MKSDKVDKKLIPPDGGWGWIIVVAYALNNVSNFLINFKLANECTMCFVVRTNV